jgi:hypothetical protein
LDAGSIPVISSGTRRKPILVPHPMAAYLQANQSKKMMMTLIAVEVLMSILIFTI